MKLISKLAALTVTAAVWTNAAIAQTGMSAAVVESTIRSLEEQERVAVLGEDIATLERVWSEQLVVNNPQNAVSPDRSAVIALVREGRIRYSSFERQIEAVRQFGNIIVVMGSETVVRREEGGRASPPIARRFTHVWRKENDAWRLTARHASVIPK